MARHWNSNSLNHTSHIKNALHTSKTQHKPLFCWRNTSLASAARLEIKALQGTYIQHMKSRQCTQRQSEQTETQSFENLHIVILMKQVTITSGLEENICD